MNLKHACAAIFTAGLFAATSGCHAHHVGEPSAPLQVNLVADLTVDIDVGPIAEGVAEEKFMMFMSMGLHDFSESVAFSNGTTSGTEVSRGFFSGEKFAKVKAAAVFDALKNNPDCFLVNPRYEIHVDDYFFYKKVNCIVHGNIGKVLGKYRQINRG